jgi:hypothetical protein
MRIPSTQAASEPGGFCIRFKGYRGDPMRAVRFNVFAKTRHTLPLTSRSSTGEGTPEQTLASGFYVPEGPVKG